MPGLRQARQRLHPAATWPTVRNLFCPHTAKTLFEVANRCRMLQFGNHEPKRRRPAPEVLCEGSAGRVSTERGTRNGNARETQNSAFRIAFRERIPGTPTRNPHPGPQKRSHGVEVTRKVVEEEAVEKEEEGLYLREVLHTVAVAVALTDSTTVP